MADLPSHAGQNDVQRVLNDFRCPFQAKRDSEIANCTYVSRNGVSSRSSGATWIFQEREMQSNVVKTAASPNESMKSSMRGRGYEFAAVLAFRRQ